MERKSETMMTFIIDKDTGEMTVMCDMEENSVSHDLRHTSFFKKFMKGMAGRKTPVEIETAYDESESRAEEVGSREKRSVSRGQ